MTLRKNASLWVGLAVPLLMMIFVAGSIYLPQLFVEPPQHDFLYMTDPYVYNGWDYQVIGGKLTRTSALVPGEQQTVETNRIFYVHETTTDSNRELTFDEASALTLLSGERSPDGYEFIHGSNGGFLFFDGSYDDPSYYLRGNGIAREVNLQTRPDSYYSVRFLGWLPNN